MSHFFKNKYIICELKKNKDSISDAMLEILVLIWRDKNEYISLKYDNSSSRLIIIHQLKPKHFETHFSSLNSHAIRRKINHKVKNNFNIHKKKYLKEKRSLWGCIK